MIGVFALAFNLRPSVTSLPPIFLDLQRLLGLSPGLISLLAAVPLLCFSAFTLLAAPAARRLGEERVLAIATAVLAVGLLVRGLVPPNLLFVGTIIATGAISLLNVLLSSLIKRRYPERAGVLLAIYLTALYLGSILGSALAVPILHHSKSVSLALSLWAATALLAFVLWLPQLSRGRLPPASAVHLPLYKSALAWQVAAFMGLQSLTYYGTVSWLPTMLRERGLSATHAGLLSAAPSSVGRLVTAFSVPGARSPPERPAPARRAERHPLPGGDGGGVSRAARGGARLHPRPRLRAGSGARPRALLLHRPLALATGRRGALGDVPGLRLPARRHRAGDHRCRPPGPWRLDRPDGDPPRLPRR